MIDVRRLRVLSEVAERGSVAAAAAALHLTPSAVSQQLATLSREARVPLLAKSGRGVRLTPQAQILLRHAASVHEQMERARADLHAYDEGLLGEVVVGAFATAISGVLVPVLGELTERRPNVAIKILEREAPECAQELANGDLDLAVTIDCRHAPDASDRRWKRIVIGPDPFDLLVPENHPVAARGLTTLTDHRNDNWIGGRAGACHESALASCLAAGFTPTYAHQCGDWTAVAALVGVGSGVAMVPRLALPTTPPGTVRLRIDTAPSRTIIAVVRAGSERSPLLQPLLSAMVSAYASTH